MWWGVKDKRRRGGVERERCVERVWRKGVEKEDGCKGGREREVVERVKKEIGKVVVRGGRESVEKYIGLRHKTIFVPPPPPHIKK